LHRRGHRRWWRGSWGCGAISSIVGILIFLFILGILSHAIQSSLPRDLH
jgi:hypothetical protein